MGRSQSIGKERKLKFTYYLFLFRHGITRIYFIFFREIRVIPRLKEIIKCI